MYDSGATSVLPTGERMNPASPTGATYFDAGQVAYVMTRVDEPRSRPTRVLTSFGGLSANWAVGTVHDLRHDQTWGRLGSYRVVGVATFATGATEGEVPNRKLAHAVFK